VPNRTALIGVAQRFLDRLAPPPDLTVSQWADRYRRLSPEASAEPGKWSTARAEYQRGIMDALSQPTIHTVVLKTSSQVGKTEIILNTVGFYVDQDPAPILTMLPTLELSESFSKDRLAPMLRDTPALRDKVRDPRSRDSGNTLREKTFAGGHITMIGANSPAALSARPIRILLADEIDRYPPSAGTEGDPLDLARKRTTTFWNRKIVVAGTPTVDGLSRIDAEWQASDQRLCLVPCEACGHEQALRWRSVRWPEGRPEAAAYVCESCGSAWDDVQRWRAIRQCRWESTRITDGVAGFHLNEIYSSWVELGKMAADFLVKKRHPETLKVFINTSLGETWREDAERIDPHALEGRGETWDKVPAWVLLITCGIDLQDDRLEVTRVGWGAGEEAAVLEHRIIYGDPSADALWAELDAYLLERWESEDGRHLPVAAACLDTAGHYTQAAYAFCVPRFRRRVYAIKGLGRGAGGQNRPVWPKRASRNNKARVNLFIVGVDAAKDMVLARLKVTDPGPGYVHFAAGLDHEYYAQLAAERVVTRYVRGFPIRVYEKDPSQRNEALDCMVYAYAALVSLNVRWGALAARVAAHAHTPVKTGPVPAMAGKPAGRRTGGMRIIGTARGLR